MEIPKILRPFYDIVMKARVPGVGPLFTYDVAERMAVGHYKFDPSSVYLHSGAAQGAGYLGVVGSKLPNGAHRAPKSDFPEAMQCLSESQAEDYLCIFKDRIRQCQQALDL